MLQSFCHTFSYCNDTILTPLVAGYSIYAVILLATLCECSVRLSVYPLAQKLLDQEISVVIARCTEYHYGVSLLLKFNEVLDLCFVHLSPLSIKHEIFYPSDS